MRESDLEKRGAIGQTLSRSISNSDRSISFSLLFTARDLKMTHVATKDIAVHDELKESAN